MICYFFIVFMSSVLEILDIEELKIRKNNLLYQIQQVSNELEKREKLISIDEQSYLEEVSPKPKKIIKIKKKE